MFCYSNLVLNKTLNSNPLNVGLHSNQSTVCKQNHGGCQVVKGAEERRPSSHMDPWLPFNSGCQIYTQGIITSEYVMLDISLLYQQSTFSLNNINYTINNHLSMTPGSCPNGNSYQIGIFPSHSVPTERYLPIASLGQWSSRRIVRLIR